MRSFIVALLALITTLFAPAASAQPAPRPTIVLVHGAFADSSSWNGVIAVLQRDGYTVVAVANPLRGLRSDADAVADVVRSIPGPVVLVGHSYGGAVISEAALGQPNVQSLVYVAAFAPDTGESVLALTGKFPGSTLGAALAPPVTLKSGASDLYIQQPRFHAQFAADVPAADARLMAAGQRPVTDAALGEAATEPAWRTIPSWFVYGDRDLNIPPAALAFMAKRAGARRTVLVPGGSHVVMISHPAEVAALIEQAAGRR